MKYYIGQSASFTKTISKEDVKVFSNITGDINPIHLDESFARNTIFKKPIVHGILVSGLISSVIANDLPGEGAIYLGQELIFKAPVYHGDTLTAKVEVTEIIEDKGHLILGTTVINEYGVLVIDGKARVKVNLKLS